MAFWPLVLLEWVGWMLQESWGWGRHSDESTFPLLFASWAQRCSTCVTLDDRCLNQWLTLSGITIDTWEYMNSQEYGLELADTGQENVCKSLCASFALLRRRMWLPIFYVVHGALQQDIFDNMHHHASEFLGPEKRNFLCKRFGQMLCALGQKLLVLRLTPSTGVDLCWDF